MIARIGPLAIAVSDKLDVELGDFRALRSGRNRAGAPMSVYSQIARAVYTAGWIDPAFHRIRDALRAWFPAEGA